MQPGERIGAWELEYKLGEGAMGEVWRAHRVDDPGVIAAFKRIKGEITADRARRFLREAAILADLDHPGVPTFRDYSTQPAFLAMEFVEGRSVGDLIKQHHAFSVADSLEIGRQLVDAITYLHGRGIWHRDIKPDNLVLTADGWVKLVDFGVARGEGYEDLTAAGMVVGTMAYMPPEVFRGLEPEPIAWDLYAAGVVLHRCLTGRNGFETDKTGVEGQTEQARRKLELPSLELGPDWPEDVRALVRDLTTREPAGRITSPGQAGRRLQELVRAYPDSQLPALVNPPERAKNVPERQGGGVVIAVVGVLAVTFLLLLTLALFAFAVLIVAIRFAT